MQPNFQKFLFIVPRAIQDVRLDKALHTLLDEEYGQGVFSRAFVTRCIREKKVFLNGAPAKPGTLVRGADRIDINEEIFRSESSEVLSDIGQLAPRVIFENDLLLVLSKPAGVQMHPARRQTGDTLTDWLKVHFPDIRDVGEDATRPGIVHRLDRETSGIVVIPKTAASFSALKEQFQKRAVKKTYIALVYGHMPECSGVIDKPLIRRSGELKRRIAQKEDDSATIRYAVTEYRVLARYGEFDLVLAFPHTGRTHQIRVHLASLGHPVVGDKLYVFKSIRREKTFFPSRQLLHAWRLEWELFDRTYAFSDPLPEDFRKVLQEIDPTQTLKLFQETDGL